MDLRASITHLPSCIRPSPPPSTTLPGRCFPRALPFSPAVDVRQPRTSAGTAAPAGRRRCRLTHALSWRQSDALRRHKGWSTDRPRLAESWHNNPLRTRGMVNTRLTVAAAILVRREERHVLPSKRASRVRTCTNSSNTFRADDAPAPGCRWRPLGGEGARPARSRPADWRLVPVYPVAFASMQWYACRVASCGGSAGSTHGHLPPSRATRTPAISSRAQRRMRRRRLRPRGSLWSYVR
jgi:hypothetical protein